ASKPGPRRTAAQRRARPRHTGPQAGPGHLAADLAVRPGDDEVSIGEAKDSTGGERGIRTRRAFDPYTLSRADAASKAVYAHLNNRPFYRVFIHGCPSLSPVDFPYDSVRPSDGWEIYLGSASAITCHPGASPTGSG